jgi:hypothetical protein
MYSQIESTSLSEHLAGQIIGQVANAIAGAEAHVRSTEYVQSKRVNGADGGRVFTSRRTIVIEIDGGDPNLEVDYLEANCCG